MADRGREGALKFLIVEDEPIIAYEIAGCVQDAGHEVAAIAHTIEAALESLDQGECHGAILDANLRGVSAEPVAKKLSDAGLPFVVVTGYDTKQIGDWVGDAMVLAKPFQWPALVKLVAQMAERIVASRTTK